MWDTLNVYNVRKCDRGSLRYRKDKKRVKTKPLQIIGTKIIVMSMIERKKEEEIIKKKKEKELQNFHL